MPIRAPFARVLLWTLALVLGLVAVAGGLAVRGPEIVAIGVAGVLAGCMAAGISRETPPGARRWSTLEAAASVGATTVAVLLVIAGIAALAGGTVAFLAVGVAVAAVLLVRAARGRRPATPSAGELPRHPGVVRPAPPLGAADVTSLLPPVRVLTTAELGQEWLRTNAVLAGRLGAAARQSLVERREEVLDELECRDPAGFERWLADGSTLSSDPVGYVRDGRLRGDPAADTDAA